MLLSSQALNCDAHATDSQGCGFRSQTASAGAGINGKKGGVYAVSLTDDGVKAWFFSRNAVPEDITSQSPNPAGWGTPDMLISAASCNPISNYFQDLGLIVSSYSASTSTPAIDCSTGADAVLCYLRLTPTLLEHGPKESGTTRRATPARTIRALRSLALALPPSTSSTTAMPSARPTGSSAASPSTSSSRSTLPFPLPVHFRALIHPRPLGATLQFLAKPFFTSCALLTSFTFVARP